MALKFLNDGYFAGKVGIGTDNPTSRLTISSSTGGDHTWDESGILIQNLSTTTGESAVVFKNSGTAGTGTNYWFSGLNQSNIYRLAYGPNFENGYTFFQLSSLGALTLDAYDSTNNTGTPTYLLGTDASGNVVKVLGSGIPGVPAGSGTLNTIPLWTPDGDTLGNSIITQPSTGNVRVSGNSVYFSVTDTSAAARNIDIGRWISGQTNIESEGGTLSIGTQSNHNIVFETNGSTKATILSGGNVGIGTTTPLANLDIGNDSGSIYQRWSYDNPGANNYFLSLSETVSSGNVRFSDKDKK